MSHTDLITLVMKLRKTVAMINRPDTALIARADEFLATADKYVLVPVEPPIDEIEAIVACLGDDAAMLREQKADCEIAANMEQAAALIGILQLIPAITAAAQEGK